MWIMWCTCDADRAALVTSLSHRVTKESYDDLLTTECQHIYSVQEPLLKKWMQFTASHHLLILTVSEKVVAFTDGNHNHTLRSLIS